MTDSINQFASSVVKTKVCGGQCKYTLPTSEFGIKDKAKGTFRHMCKACVRENSKKHYQANTQEYVDKAAERNKKTRESNKLVMEKFLTGCQCMDCATKEDLHPRSPKDDASRPAWTLLTGSSKTLLLELSKAQILCSVCLGKRTGKFLHEWAGMTSKEKAEKAMRDRELAAQRGDAIKPKGFYQSYIPRGITPDEHLHRQAARAQDKAEKTGGIHG